MFILLKKNRTGYPLADSIEDWKRLNHPKADMRAKFVPKRLLRSSLSDIWAGFHVLRKREEGKCFYEPQTRQGKDSIEAIYAREEGKCAVEKKGNAPSKMECEFNNGKRETE
ncbi:hypothetical protein QE152_g17930 [Popillia japonica]|uniref:Uncharacterized protein n=1 Tax=Popillia japonica TaxID=7064 RepID=A0AAW1L1N8_POPJA